MHHVIYIYKGNYMKISHIYIYSTCVYIYAVAYKHLLTNVSLLEILWNYMLPAPDTSPFLLLRSCSLVHCNAMSTRQLMFSKEERKCTASEKETSNAGICWSQSASFSNEKQLNNNKRDIFSNAQTSRPFSVKYLAYKWTCPDTLKIQTLCREPDSDQGYINLAWPLGVAGNQKNQPC